MLKGNVMYSQSPIITVAEGEALLSLAVASFENNKPFPKSLREFCARNYSVDDLVSYGVDAGDFEKWINE